MPSAGSSRGATFPKRLYKATIEDPAAWTRPWTLEYPFVAAKGPICEYACHEGNYAIEDIPGGARNMEKAAARAK